MGIGLEDQNKTEVKKEATIANKYALLIGVEKFNDAHIPQLTGVTKDMLNFKKLLEDRSFSNFQVSILTDTSLISARKAISEISKKAGEDDVVFFYYSGHGLLQNRSLYLLLTDSEPQFEDATCMEAEYILSQFRKSKCKNFILIVDACHSGAFFNNNRGLPNGLVALTACDEDQLAYDTVDGGMFSNIIINGLKSDYIDADRDGRITFSELFDYITRKVKLQTQRNTPKKWEWNVHEDIYLFDSPRPVFISYQRSQKALVKKISEAFKKEDIATFVDLEKIRVGDNWRENLAKSIKKARAFLFIMDNNILNSEVANWELETAHLNQVPILPIEVEDNIKVHAMFSKQYGHYNRMHFDEKDFGGSMATIIDHIKAIRISEPEVEDQKIGIR